MANKAIVAKLVSGMESVILLATNLKLRVDTNTREIAELKRRLDARDAREHPIERHPYDLNRVAHRE